MLKRALISAFSNALILGALLIKENYGRNIVAFVAPIICAILLVAMLGVVLGIKSAACE